MPDLKSQELVDVDHLITYVEKALEVESLWPIRAGKDLALDSRADVLKQFLSKFDNQE